MAKHQYYISYIVYTLREVNTFEVELKDVLNDYDDNYEFSINAYNTKEDYDVDPIPNEPDPDEEEIKYEVSVTVGFSKDIDFEKLASELKEQFGSDLECSIADL